MIINASFFTEPAIHEPVTHIQYSVQYVELQILDFSKVLFLVRYPGFFLAAKLSSYAPAFYKAVLGSILGHVRKGVFASFCDDYTGEAQCGAPRGSL
jgi:hypothetical protein